MRPNFVRNLKHQDPDLLFFAGDQSYDHREHTAAWLKFGPAVSRRASRSPLRDDSRRPRHRPAQPVGREWQGVDLVRCVRRRIHLPSGVRENGRAVPNLGISPIRSIPRLSSKASASTSLGCITRASTLRFSKTASSNRAQQARFHSKVPAPTIFTTPDYNPSSLDVAGLKLLGDRQLKFLEEWATDRTPGEQKVVLSQTVFCGGPHLHGSKNNRLYCDLDSNGWPQTGRNAAVRLIGKSGAVHLAGDQHIAMLLEYGADEYRDGGWAFASPAIVNTIYGRWWAPVDGQPGGNPDVDSPLELTGDYLDGFGNKITMHAYANAEPGDRAEGYGLVRFDKQASTATFECWPREADVTKPDAEQFKGWPRTVELRKPGS